MTTSPTPSTRPRHTRGDATNANQATLCRRDHPGNVTATARTSHDASDGRRTWRGTELGVQRFWSAVRAVPLVALAAAIPLLWGWGWLA